MALTSVESFHSPTDISAVVQLLQRHEDSALIIAGGTFLHGLASRGLLTGIEALIDIQNLGLDNISVDNHNVVIGATTRLAQLECKCGDTVGSLAGCDKRRRCLSAAADHEFRNGRRFRRLSLPPV